MEVKVFTDALLEAVSLLNGQSVSLCYHRDNVDVPMKMFHELHINRTKAREGEGEGEGERDIVLEIGYL